MKNIQANDLIDFCLVVDHGGIRPAARFSNKPKSSISLSIKRLEQSLAARLIESHTKNLKLTAIGQDLYHDAYPLIAQLNDLSNKYLADNFAIEGKLKIAAPYEFSAHHLTHIVGKLVTKNPNLSIVLDEQALPVKELFNLGYDIVFIMTNEGLIGMDGVLCKVYMLERALYASPHFIAQGIAINTLDDLRKVDLIASSTEFRWRFRIEENETFELQIPDINFKSSNAKIRRSAAIAGEGVTCLVKSFCQPYVDTNQLVQVLPQYTCAPLYIYAVVKDKRLMPMAVQKLLQELDETAPEVFIEKNRYQ